MNRLYTFIIILLAIVSLIGCGAQSLEEPVINEVKSVNWMDTIQKPEVGEPIWGYRFVLVGDFNADRQQDTLIEYFIDDSTGLETNKFFTDLPNSDHQYYDVKFRQVYSFLLSKQEDIDTLYAGGLGPLYAEVIGDIDGDGGDEIGMVYMDATPSNLNSYNILSYQDGKWKDIGGVAVRDFDFPPLPGYNKRYGLFGAAGEFDIEDDSINLLVEEQLLNYQHAKLVAPKTIEVEGHGYFACEHNSIIREKVVNTENAYWVEIGWDEENANNFYAYHWGKIDLNGYYEEDRAEIYEKMKSGKFDYCDPASTVLQRIKFK
jgi:hypothetical protein